MPEYDPIIRCDSSEVNGWFAQRPDKKRIVTLPSVLSILVAVIILLSISIPTISCSCRERSSQKMYREAMRMVEEDNFDEAVELLGRVVREFPGTPAAEAAEKDLELYRGLAGAVNLYSTRKARDAMVRAARALETYRMKRGRLPGALEDVLPETPLDSWGNPLIYDRKSNSRYTLESLGADGVRGGEGEDADLVIRNGRFASASRESGR